MNSIIGYDDNLGLPNDFAAVLGCQIKAYHDLVAFDLSDGLFTENTILTFKDASSFPDLLQKTARDEVDCSMMWSVIMQRHPEDADKVREFFSKKDLPTPVIIGHAGSPLSLVEKLCHFETQDEKSFFQGFALPDIDRIEGFKSEMKKAKEYFEVKCVTP